METETKKILTCIWKAQTLLETIDELEDRVLFKRELKQKTLNYKNYLERYLKQFTSNMDGLEADAYIEVSKRVDEVFNNVFVEIEG